MDGRLLGRDAHHLRSAPGHRADVGVTEVHRFQHLTARRVDLVGAIGDLESHRLCRVVQPIGVLAQLEDSAFVSALAFKYAAGVVQRVRQDVQPRVAPLG